MNDVLQQRCLLCGSSYPHSEEFFYALKRQDGAPLLRKVCKKCHNQQSANRKKQKEEKQLADALENNDEMIVVELESVNGTTHSELDKDLEEMARREAESLEEGTEAIEDEPGQSVDSDISTASVPLQRCFVCGTDYPQTTEFFYTDKGRTNEDGTIVLRKLCKKCHNWRTQEALRRRREGQRSTIEALTSELEALKYELGITGEDRRGTPDQCGACGTKTGNILGDVDERTREEYGYLCSRCYKLVTAFHANPARMRKVLAYIERTRGSYAQRDLSGN